MCSGGSIAEEMSSAEIEALRDTLKRFDEIAKNRALNQVSTHTPASASASAFTQHASAVLCDCVGVGGAQQTRVICGRTQREGHTYVRFCACAIGECVRVRLSAAFAVCVVRRSRLCLRSCRKRSLNRCQRSSAKCKTSWTVRAPHLLPSIAAPSTLCLISFSLSCV